MNHEDTQYLIAATFSSEERIEQHNRARDLIEKKLKRLDQCVDELGCLSENFEEIKEAAKELADISTEIQFYANRQHSYEEARKKDCRDRYKKKEEEKRKVNESNTYLNPKGDPVKGRG
jgi:uncharacterized protein YoxC